LGASNPVISFAVTNRKHSEEPPLLLLLLGLKEAERPHGGVFVLGVRDGDLHLGGDPVVLPDLGEHLRRLEAGPP
jgi:hypothetical protein